MQPSGRRQRTSGRPRTAIGGSPNCGASTASSTKRSCRSLKAGGATNCSLQRLKKRKLLIKDSITQLEMGLVPDIPA